MFNKSQILIKGYCEVAAKLNAQFNNFALFLQTLVSSNIFYTVIFCIKISSPESATSTT